MLDVNTNFSVASDSVQGKLLGVRQVKIESISIIMFPLVLACRRTHSKIGIDSA